MSVLLAYVSGADGPREETVYTDLLPIGVCSLHALLRSKGVDAYLANLTHRSSSWISSYLKRLNPGLVGLSLWTHNRHATIDLVRLVRQVLPACTIILGGGHASQMAETLLSRHPEIDLVVRGEGEETLLELLAAREAGIPYETVPGLALRSEGLVVLTPPRHRVQNLDDLPFPSAFLNEASGVDLDLQPQFISTARGCPSACRFCGSPTFWGRRVQFRSALSVANEFIWLKQQYGLLYLSLRDDTFTADKKRTETLCRELLQRRATLLWNCQTRVEAVDETLLVLMKQAGCECVQLGVESGSPRILQQLGKRITPEQAIRAAEAVHRVGLSLSIYLITGIPGESAEDRKATLELVRKIGPHDLQVSPLAYFPGTVLYDEALQSGLVSPECFDAEQGDALLALPDGKKQAKRLLREGSALLSIASAAGFTAVRKRIGYTAVGNIQSGDYHAQQGNGKQAEAAYREITEREPDHPWGWLLLGEYCEERRRREEAARCFKKVLELVPQHRQSHEALKRLHEQSSTY